MRAMSKSWKSKPKLFSCRCICAVEERVDISGLVFPPGSYSLPGSRILQALSTALHWPRRSYPSLSSRLLPDFDDAIIIKNYQQTTTAPPVFRRAPLPRPLLINTAPCSSCFGGNDASECSEKREKQGTHPISGRKPPECGRR